MKAVVGSRIKSLCFAVCIALLPLNVMAANWAPTCSGFHGLVTVNPGYMNNFGCWAMDMEHDTLCVSYTVTPQAGAPIFFWPYVNNSCHEFNPNPSYPMDEYVSYDPTPPGCGAFNVSVRYTQQVDGQFCECNYTLYEPCPGDPPGCTTFDQCGKCNGDGSTCTVPTPTPSGTPTPTPTPGPCTSGHYDACGICDGPNTSCDCAEEDLYPYNVQFDSNAQVLFHFHKDIQKIIRKFTGKDFPKLLLAADAAYLSSWQITNLSLPTVQLYCPTTMDCVTVSTVGYIKQLLKNNNTILNLTIKLVKKAQKLEMPQEKLHIIVKRLKKMKYLHGVTKLNAQLVPKLINVNCSPGT